MSDSSEGIVVAAFGRHYAVELAGGGCRNGIPRGKRSIYACGDRVAVDPISASQVQILRHLPRGSLLYRSDAYREKLIAANATQIVLVAATEPSFSDELLTRALVAAESQGLRAIIVLNKVDLIERLPQAKQRLAPFVALGYSLIGLSAKIDATPLVPYLAGELSVLVGQSGMGKSTLINALVPDAAATTREISTALDSGRHTTTHARLYPLEHGGSLIDSPGLQEFGLAHLSLAEIEQGFVEFRPYLGLCRFRDCRHRSEPGCALREAVSGGRIDERRFAQYLRIATAAERPSRA